MINYYTYIPSTEKRTFDQLETDLVEARIARERNPVAVLERLLPAFMKENVDPEVIEKLRDYCDETVEVNFKQGDEMRLLKRRLILLNVYFHLLLGKLKNE